MLPALPLALLFGAPAFVTLVGAPYAIDATLFIARWRRGRSLAAAGARIAHWPRRFLVRARLVHDVLRVVLARVGLRAAALRCEQQHSKEWEEGLPHQCEELPPSSLKHSRGRHSCRSAFSKQVGSNVARNRSVL